MKGFITNKILGSNKMELCLSWLKSLKSHTTSDFVSERSVFFPNNRAHFIYRAISLNIYVTDIKYHNLRTDPPSEQNVPTAVTKVILRRVISHNSSQMDSREIKSASQTASWGGNIPLQFFIDLHSVSPWYFFRFAPPSLPSIALSETSPSVFNDERHNIHQVKEKKCGITH